MSMRFALPTFVAFACAGFAQAGIPTTRPVSKIYAQASVVVEATVKKIEGSCVAEKTTCNNNYLISIDVVNRYKGSFQKATSVGRICSNSALEIGETYTLFFEAPNQFNDVGSNKCDLVVDYDGVFEKIGSYTYRIGAPDMQVIVDYEGSKFMTNAVVEPEFERTLRGIIGKK